MTISAAKLPYLYYLYGKELSYFQYKSYYILSYLYDLYDKDFHTFNTSHTRFGAAIRRLRMGLSWVLQAEFGVLQFQFGNCQRAICVGGIAATRPDTPFLQPH